MIFLNYKIILKEFLKMVRMYSVNEKTKNLKT